MNDYESLLVSVEDSLKNALLDLNIEISRYPTPISGCDAQFNHMLATRSKIHNMLAEMGAEVFVPTPRTPNQGDRVESR